MDLFFSMPDEYEHSPKKPKDPNFDVKAKIKELMEIPSPINYSVKHKISRRNGPKLLQDINRGVHHSVRKPTFKKAKEKRRNNVKGTVRKIKEVKIPQRLPINRSPVKPGSKKKRHLLSSPGLSLLASPSKQSALEDNQKPKFFSSRSKAPAVVKMNNTIKLSSINGEVELKSSKNAFKKKNIGRYVETELEKKIASASIYSPNIDKLESCGKLGSVSLLSTPPKPTRFSGGTPPSKKTLSANSSATQRRTSPRKKLLKGASPPTIGSRLKASTPKMENDKTDFDIKNSSDGSSVFTPQKVTPRKNLLKAASPSVRSSPRMSPRSAVTPNKVTPSKASPSVRSPRMSPRSVVTPNKVTPSKNLLTAASPSVRSSPRMSPRSFVTPNRVTPRKNLLKVASPSVRRSPRRSPYRKLDQGTAPEPDEWRVQKGVSKVVDPSELKENGIIDIIISPSSRVTENGSKKVDGSILKEVDYNTSNLNGKKSLSITDSDRLDFLPTTNVSPSEAAALKSVESKIRKENSKESSELSFDQMNSNSKEDEILTSLIKENQTPEKSVRSPRRSPRKNMSSTPPSKKPVPADSEKKNGTDALGNKNVKYFPIFEPKNHQYFAIQQNEKPDRNKNTLSKKNFILKKSDSSQLIIDAGQKHFGAAFCKDCGMVYEAGDPEEEDKHMKMHSRVSSILRFNGWKLERQVTNMDHIGGKIFEVTPRDSALWWRKLKDVLEVVDAELGFSESSLKCVHNSTAYFYVLEKQIVGLLVCEFIQKAYRVIQQDTPAAAAFGDSDREKSKLICCSDTPEKVYVGVSRIWVLAGHRRRGIASRLLDAMRANLMKCHFFSVDEFAFSDPTLFGIKFAERYTKKSNFLVYRRE